MIEAAALSACAGVRHGFLTRRGGVSQGVFDALNCGYGSGDDHQFVRENRQRAAAGLGLDLGADDLATLHQVHSADVVEVTQAWRLDERPKADALVTRATGLALGVLTADCVPVLFADADAGVIGAAHAGWKGALAGVVEATVGAMHRLGAGHDRIVAAIGPCIRQESYEVGGELRAAFLAGDAGNGQFFKASPRDGHYMFDLAGFVAAAAHRAGLTLVEDLRRDTYAEENLFFSYRRATHRNESDYGRGLSLISLEPR